MRGRESQNDKKKLGRAVSTDQIRDGTLGSPDNERGGGIEILCASDDRFLPHLATMLCSLLEHNTVLRIHLFYSSIDDYTLAELESFVTGYGSAITRYEMDPNNFQKLQVDKHVSIATYYRVLAPRILPLDISKILYLDSDVIVRNSLRSLWNTDLRDHAVAAVIDQSDVIDAEKLAELGLPAKVNYFNAGVLLINLNFWRQHNICEKTIAFARNHPEKVTWWDQDALNAILVHRWIELRPVWNLQCWSLDKRMSATKDAVIVHFCGQIKPWHWSPKRAFRSEYRKYRRKTPWPQYRLEGTPPWHQRLRPSIRNAVRTVLPFSMREWLRSRIKSL